MSDPQFNAIETNSLESVGKRPNMKKTTKKKMEASMDDGDGAHWISSKANKKRPERKASAAKETKKRFKENTLKVKTSGKKSKKTARIKM